MTERPEESAGAAAVESLHWRRLHPATVLVDFLRRLGKLAYVIVVALVVRLMGGGGGGPHWADYVIGVIAVFGAVGALFRYLVTRYAVQSDRLVIRTGLITRQLRTIPLERIQNIELERGVAHRILGVVDVNIETAGGSKAEGRLSALAVGDAERLKAELLERRDGGPADVAVEESAEVIWEASLGDLLLTGATGNRAGWIAAGLMSLLYLFGWELGGLPAPLAALAQSAQASGTAAVVAFVLAGLVLLILAGWVVSILWTLVLYFGFVLRRGDDRLRRKYGLFTQRESVVPLRRVQILKLEAPLLRRLLGYTTVMAETAGSVVDRQSGGAAPLCLLVRPAGAAKVCREVFPDLDLAGVVWTPVSRLTIRRGFIRYALISLALVGVIAVAVNWWVAVLTPMVLGLALVAAWLRYRALAFAEHGNYVLARAGVLTRRVWIVPQGKVQWLSSTQSPFQRRLDLASLAINTAGSKQLSGAEIVDLPAAAAHTLQDRLSRVASAQGLWLADGV
jgi:putative membrane protein